MKIGGFILTRDSWWFFWGKLVGAATAIVTGAFDAKTLGLTDKQQHTVMLVAGAIVALSAQLATSALPGKSDADKVSLPVKDTK
jgi:hypothetical protein